MAEYKIDYKLTAPQTYDRGDVGEKNTKLSRDTQRGTVTVNAPNFEEAKKKAKPLIKNSKTFNNFSSRQSFDSPRKPSIKILKPIKAPGGGRDKDGVIQVQEKLLIRDTKFKGGLIRKPKLATKGY
mgnify:FL=1|tara:strand:- start:180 stop:557 length:378 start_codon:yes stop_codon:yes gene_type:complete